MNTGKQINAMVVVLFLTLITLGAYTIWDPLRSDTAEEEQVEMAVERGATTFALNCRLCHGDRGEGGVDGGRLPAALPLNVDRLQGIQDGAFSQPAYDAAFKLVSNTIMCGRAGTSMPTWGQSQGGALSTEQIRQLALLITLGRWELAQEHADEIDAMATEHATVQMPDGSFGASDTELIVSNASLFSLGQYIRIDDERLRVRQNELEVQRGADGTEASSHESGALVLRAEGGAFIDTGETLRHSVEPEDSVLVVNDLKGFTVGDTLRLGSEAVRIVDIVTGLPTTGQRLAEEIGRTADELLVSGADAIEVGTLIRVHGELMEVVAIRDDGESGNALEAGISATDRRISVNDPGLFGEGYVLRLGEELVEVQGPVETGQALGESVGRAETTLAVSGTQGIEAGMVIRIGRELLRVTEVLEPARLEIERAADDTQAASHRSGTAFVRLVEGAEEGETVEQPTGQKLLEAVGPDGTLVTVSGTTGVSVGGTFQLGDELVRIVNSRPARLRVERGVERTSRDGHARRVPLYEANLLVVERGVGGTQPQAHSEGEQAFLTVVEVKRAAGGSKLEVHSKNAEIFLGHRLIMERGVLGSEAAEHPSGALVLNFPPAPEGPTITQEACGQRAVAPAPETPAGPTQTPVAGAQEVVISLSEWSVSPDPATIADGPVTFQVSNEGVAVHNFRVFATDLAPDSLPVAVDRVDEESDQLDVVGGIAGAIPAGTSQTVAVDLPPGSYVLVCNVPTHYQTGMFVGFQVTAP
ncbi:MAG: hypothetical protein A2148_10130 [Chloroflexi bacterium RBG_16_68_14]|nr:MAG: hypothetical protein A2148_10130 [Chloroflexi bacterium RBG_16_68_14]